MEYFWQHSDILKNHNVNCNLPSCTIAAHRDWSTVMYHREWLPWMITSVLGLLQRRLKEWLLCSAYYSDDLKIDYGVLIHCVVIHLEDYVCRESVHNDVRRGNKQTVDAVVAGIEIHSRVAGMRREMARWHWTLTRHRAPATGNARFTSKVHHILFF